VTNERTIIIGAGPAGLTAGYVLSKENRPVLVLEADPVYVGGISRTVRYKGFHFDIGGHRFFSKSREIEDLWTEILPDDMLERPRSSRIFYDGKFFTYPLKGFEALKKLGPVEAALCLASYAKAKAAPVEAKNYEEWVTNQFGRRLFEIFFKTYTEKVWGMACTEISADWAAQRIKGLSLGRAILNALLPKKPAPRGEVVKTLIDSFRYPRKGPGMLWEACAERIRGLGGEVRLGRRVVAVARDGDGMLVEHEGPDGERQTDRCAHVISSAPLRELVGSLTPAVSAETRRAAEALRYRDFLTVVLILKERHQFDDNWIYIHDPSVKVGRVQNFKSWSPEMVPDPTLACYGLEYFCFEGDGLWTSTDEELRARAERELLHLGLARPGDIVDSCVVRQKKAYPVYDDHYQQHCEVIRTELERDFPGLHLVGRNGMHKYNNQDHAMMTAWLASKNIVSGTRQHNVWRVNEDAEYHEKDLQGGASGLRSAPFVRS
jgi:protoporphyrinogen oxidase